MRTVTKENLIVQIDRLRKIKDEQGQLSMSGEYTLQAYEMLLATMEAEPMTFKYTGDGNFYGFGFYLDGEEIDIDMNKPLYTSPQPAPVVPDDVSIFEAAIEKCKTCDSIDEHAWNHGVLAVIAEYESCRAAMLNRK